MEEKMEKNLEMMQIKQKRLTDQKKKQSIG